MPVPIFLDALRVPQAEQVRLRVLPLVPSGAYSKLHSISRRAGRRTGMLSRCGLSLVVPASPRSRFGGTGASALK